MMRIGILFGGPGREREISFAGGKTALAHLNKTLFQAIPIFVDADGHLVKIKESLMQAEAIRDFYPSKAHQQGPFLIYAESLSPEEREAERKQLGESIPLESLNQHIDFAFIAMHGPGTEDGSLQGLLEWLNIPYSGPGLLGSSIGIDKAKQNLWLEKSVGLDKAYFVLNRQDYERFGRETLFEQVKKAIGLPMVAKAPHQGSSIGLAFIKQDDVLVFDQAIKTCLFIQEIYREDWLKMDEEAQIACLQAMTDLDRGIGFPVIFNKIVYAHPMELWEALKQYFTLSVTKASIQALNSEDAVLLEAFVHGKEFSCGVVQDPKGEAIALPPTEIIIDAQVEVFDFNAKYKSKATRKRIPMEASLLHLQHIQSQVKQAFEDLGFGVCTRIDGFLKPDGTVVLHDPNTIPGMSPRSLIFKQMAEIGLNITDALTYFIRQSIRERMRSGKGYQTLRAQLEALDTDIAQALSKLKSQEKEVVWIKAKNAQELAIAFEAGKNQAHALASLGDRAFEVRLDYLGQEQVLHPAQWSKDHVDELWSSVQQGVHPLIAQTREAAKELTEFYT